MNASLLPPQAPKGHFGSGESSITLIRTKNTSNVDDCIESCCFDVTCQMVFMYKNNSVINCYHVSRTSMCTYYKTWVRSEDTHRWGNDHCTAGLQFNWIGFDQTYKHVHICMNWNYFLQFIFELWFEKDENKQKEARIVPYVLKKYFRGSSN